MVGDGDFANFLARADEVLKQREVCRAFDKAPHVAVAGTSTVATFSEKLHVDLLFLEDMIASRAMDVFPR